MNGVKIRQGDSLNNLNVDETEITFKEKTMLDMLYPADAGSVQVPPGPGISTSQNTQNVQNVQNINPQAIAAAVKETPKIWDNFKDIIIATALFVALSLPFADGLIARVVKIDDANYRLAAKAALFALLLFLIHNFYLSRRASR